MVIEGILRAWKERRRESDLFGNDAGVDGGNAGPFDDDVDGDAEECFSRSFEVMRLCSFEASMVTSSTTGW